MKSIKKLFAMGLALMMALSIPFSVSAAELEDAPIDESRTGSLTIYKYDLTNAEKDGVWDEEMIQNVDETELQEARSLAQSYNQALAPVSSYDKEGISEASHNYDSLLNLGGNGIMGYIEIPCIQVNLPIYHGTDTETLERGVGHLLGSSLPVGGSSTHAVLSGHSGMAGQKMFTDLLQMKTGDIFYLHVLGETLAYEVDSLNTVLPHDTSLLGITDGSDLCTLITCTPIAVNSHRLLVTGHRIPFEAAKEMVEEAQLEDTEVESTWEQEYLRGLYIAIAVVLILFLICIVVALLGRNNDA